jgi:hypothetical protein
MVVLAALPLANYPFDWASLGLTRLLLARGQKKGGMWPLVYSLIDVLFGVVFVLSSLALSALMLTLVNLAAVSAGRDYVVDIGQFVEKISTRDTRFEPTLWWIYLMIFSTFVPSFLNLVIGGMSILRGIPYLSRHSLQWVPNNPSFLTPLKRVVGSALLALQFAISFFGACLVSLFILIGFWELLGYILEIISVVLRGTPIN